MKRSGIVRNMLSYVQLSIVTNSTLSTIRCAPNLVYGTVGNHAPGATHQSQSQATPNRTSKVFDLRSGPSFRSPSRLNAKCRGKRAAVGDYQFRVLKTTPSTQACLARRGSLPKRSNIQRGSKYGCLLVQMTACPIRNIWKAVMAKPQSSFPDES